MAVKSKDEYEAFRESEEAAALRNKADAVLPEANQAYASQYAAKADAALANYANRSEFEYDVNADKLYNQYKDSYTKQGKTAMEDTIARAAALTGGYANSYAQTAGQQVYNDYMSRLADKIPELEQLAYDRYRAEGEDALNKYSLLASREAQDYSRYRDDQSALNQRIGLYNDLYNDRYSRDYNAWQDDYATRYQLARDAVSDQRYENEFAYQLARDAVSDQRYNNEWDYQKRIYDSQIAANNASIAYKDKTHVTKDDLTDIYDAKEEALETKDVSRLISTLRRLYYNGVSSEELEEYIYDLGLDEGIFENVLKNVTGESQKTKEKSGNTKNTTLFGLFEKI